MEKFFELSIWVRTLSSCYYGVCLQTRDKTRYARYDLYKYQFVQIQKWIMDHLVYIYYYVQKKSHFHIFYFVLNFDWYCWFNDINVYQLNMICATNEEALINVVWLNVKCDIQYNTEPSPRFTLLGH